MRDHPVDTQHRQTGSPVTSGSDSRTRSALRWAFRDRRTGRIVIAQRPNAPLAIWIVATVIAFFVHGTVHTVVSVVGTVALVIWAIDELARGVNPWRRALGAVVLLVIVATRFGLG